MGKREDLAIKEAIELAEASALADFDPDIYREQEPDLLMPDNIDEILLSDDEVEPIIFATNDPVVREFYENFVDDLDEDVASEIALDLIEKVEGDMDSRRDWEDALVKSLKTIGIKANLNQGLDSTIPFEGASEVEFPMISKAIIQFQARALGQILPPNPAKAVVIGKSTPERESQAKRVEATINYQLDYLDKGFFNDYRKMLMYLPLAGSTFRKAYHDPILDQNITRFVKPEDFIIHYNQTDLAGTTRYTHRIYMSTNEIKKMMYLGHYADIDLDELEGMADNIDNNVIREQTEKEDGFNNSYSDEDEDRLHTIYEVHCNLDLPGYRHLDIDEQPTGIALPYIVTIHHFTRKILSIRKNWKSEDKHMNKLVWFVHYQFLPGFGFYGLGYAHVIGSVARAATSLLRSILDGTALHLLKGGFKTEDAKVEGQEMFAPGEWKSVQSTTDDLSKAFFPLEYAAPSPQVITIIEYLDKIATDVVSTTEVITGSASNTGPVGPTLALIEQSQQVYSSIHKGLHRSLGEELQLIAMLNHEYFEDEFYFESKDGEHTVYRNDFAGNVGIYPVSDPNISSFQQRQAIDQATLQLAMQFPQYFKMEKVVRRVMTNLNVTAIDEIMYSDQELMMMEQQQQQAASEQPSPIDAEIAVKQAQGDIDSALQQQKFEQEMQLKGMDYEASMNRERMIDQRSLDDHDRKMLADIIGGAHGQKVSGSKNAIR